MHYVPPPLVGPSKVALWEPSMGRLELGSKPFVVESIQVGSPAIRNNSKNRALLDGEFDDTLYHGASAITLSMRLAPHVNCNSDYWFSQLRETVAAYCHPRLRPRLYWRWPGDIGDQPGGTSAATDEAGQWATVRGDSWPFVVNGPKYPYMSIQFRNPLGEMYLGDCERAPHTATAFPGAEAGGRSYDLTHDRNYPNVASPAGTAIVRNNGNSYAGWKMEVQGPFEAGAEVNLGGVEIKFNQALSLNQSVTLKTQNKTVLRETGLSYYPFTNFGEWDWDEILLPRGNTAMTFDGELAGAPSGYATIEWYSTSI